MRAKRLMKLLIAPAMTSLAVLFTAESSQAVSMQGHIIIIQKPDPEEDPRSPIAIPFIAELMDGSNSVLLGATDTIGTVSVQIISTAGDNYSTYFDTSDGAILLPISGNAGYYTLTIITPDGTHYVGEFTI